MMPQTSLIPCRLWPQPQLPTQTFKNLNRIQVILTVWTLQTLIYTPGLSSSSNSDSDADFLSLLIRFTHCIHCFHVGLNFCRFSASYHCHSALYIFILLYIFCHSPTCMCYALWAESNKLWTLNLRTVSAWSPYSAVQNHAVWNFGTPLQSTVVRANYGRALYFSVFGIIYNIMYYRH